MGRPRGRLAEDPVRAAPGRRQVALTVTVTAGGFAKPVRAALRAVYVRPVDVMCADGVRRVLHVVENGRTVALEGPDVALACLAAGALDALDRLVPEGDEAEPAPRDRTGAGRARRRSTARG